MLFSACNYVEIFVYMRQLAGKNYSLVYYMLAC